MTNRTTRRQTTAGEPGSQPDGRLVFPGEAGAPDIGIRIVDPFPGGGGSSSSVLVPGRGADGAPVHRWECRCQPRPVLLATVDPSGRVNIKIRDRFLHVTGGRIEAACPLCGVEHALDVWEMDPA